MSAGDDRQSRPSVILFSNGTWLFVTTSETQENGKQVIVAKPTLCVPVNHHSRTILYIPVMNEELLLNLVRIEDVLERSSRMQPQDICRLGGLVDVFGTPLVQTQHGERFTTHLWMNQKSFIKLQDDDGDDVGHVVVICEGNVRVRDVVALVEESNPDGDNHRFYVSLSENNTGKVYPKEFEQEKTEKSFPPPGQPRWHYLNLGAKGAFQVRRYMQM